MRVEIAAVVLMLPASTMFLPKSVQAAEMVFASSADSSVLVADRDDNNRNWNNNNPNWNNGNPNWNNGNPNWNNNNQNRNNGNPNWNNGDRGRYPDDRNWNDSDRYGNRDQDRDRNENTRSVKVFIPGHWKPGFLGLGRKWVSGHWEYREVGRRY